MLFAGKFPKKKWYVRSKHNPEMFYLVEWFGGDEYYCQCPFNINKRKECKHIRRIKEINEQKS